MNDEHRWARTARERDGAELAATANSVRAYLRQVGKVAPLDEAQEIELAERIEAGLFAAERLDTMTEAQLAADPELCLDLNWLVQAGQRAKTRLLGANLRLVVSIAKRYTGRGMAFLELLQEGHLGLLRAVEGFDHTHGCAFADYATRWIHQAITHALAEQGGTGNRDSSSPATSPDRLRHD